MSLQIQVTHLSLGPRKLLGPLVLDISPGSIHTLMGPSGCGKSSLLAAISGSLPSAFAFEGSVALSGVALDALPTQRRGIGILFQDDLLFPHMTVRENLLFALPAGDKSSREQQVTQALQDLGMPESRHADPATLSGGQRTRVALMRALLARPQALLLDEPFARLDAALRQRMREFVFGTIRQRGIPALLVTHDTQDVADAQRVTTLA